jgi:hypothetical protein
MIYIHRSEPSGQGPPSLLKSVDPNTVGFFGLLVVLSIDKTFAAACLAWLLGGGYAGAGRLLSSFVWAVRDHF